MASQPVLSMLEIGHESQPLAILDGFVPDADALRDVAVREAFGPALNSYPGVRADLPDCYLEHQLPLIAEVVAEHFGATGDIRMIDASFSMVTTPPDELAIRQRLPHCDAFDPNQFALVHYLARDDESGTAFYRHRSTGFETIDATRADIFVPQVEAELRHGGLPTPAYVDGDTPLFEQIHVEPARYNRALLYRGWQLHSGAIPADAPLLADPAEGRLTVTGFFTVN